MSSRSEISFDSWPSGKLVAVFPVVNVELFTPGKGGPAIQPHLRSEPEIANSGWRDYGNRAGFERLRSLFAKLDIPVSAAMNSDIIEREPKVFEAIANEKQWDIVGHGKNNSQGQSGLSLVEESHDVQTALNTIRSKNKKVLGWLTPGFSVTENTNWVLSENGVRFSLDATNDDVPYRLEKGDRSIVVLPYCMETNDISLCLSASFTAQEYGDTLIDYLKQMVSEAQHGKPTIVAFGLHTFIAGTPAKAFHLERALKEIAKMPEVWFCNCSMINEHFESLNLIKSLRN